MSLRSHVTYNFGLIFKFGINKISFISIYVLPPFCQDVRCKCENDDDDIE